MSLYSYTIQLMDKVSRPLEKADKAANRFSSSMDKAASASRRADAQNSRLSSGLQSASLAFAGWGFAAVAVAGRIGAAFVQTGIQFEATMSKVRALTGAVGKDFTQLEELAKKMGRETRFSAQQAGEAMSFMAMAGLDNNQIMSALPATLNLAASTGAELGRAADVATNALSAFGLKANELGRVVDVIAKTTTTANTNIEMFAESFKFAAPLAKSAGIEIEELSAAIGILGNSGIQGSLAGTGLQTAISRLLKPSGEAARVIDNLGIKVRDSKGQLNSMASIIEQLEKAGANSADMLSIFGIEAGAKMQILLDKGSKALRGYTNDLKESGGTASRLADIMSANLQGKIDQTTARFESLAITLFDKVKPAIEAVVVGLGEFASWAERNSSGIVALSTGVAAAATAWGVYSAATTIAALTSGGLTASVIALGTALWASGIAPIAILVGALAAAFTYAYQESETFRNIVHSVGDALAEVWEGMKQLWDMLTDEKQWSAVLSGFRELGKMFGLISEEVDKADKSIKKMDKTSQAANANPFLFPFNQPKGILEQAILNNQGSADPNLKASQTGARSNSNAQQTGITQATREIAGGGPQQKNFNINIQKFQDEFIIQTETIEQGMAQTQEMFEEMFLRVLNGIQANQ